MLSGKTAVVTGASRGIGRAIAEKLAAEGAFVVINYNGSKEAAETVLAGIRAAGGDGCVMQCNVSDFAACEAWMKEILALYGKIDILVNNAGIIRRHDALTFTESDWDAVIDLNLKAVFFLSQAVARQFIRQGEGGKIINIASMLSFQGGIRVPSYTASKSGVLGLTRLLANEWAGQGINVNAIAPGYMATNNTQALREDEERNQAILERIPAGRWGAPKDLQGPVVFLASSAADYINGYTLAVDGGWLAR